ncbi:MAG: invasion associated locus B family protein [Roseobacter sp.]
MNSKFFLASALAVGLSISSVSYAIAQSAEPSEDATSDLPLGETVQTEPQAGDTYIKEEFGDWALRCIFIPDEEDRCQMYQLLIDESNNPISEFTLFRLQEGGAAAAGATIIVPLETSLGEQLTIQVDQQPAKRYPFAFCNTIGCFARIGLTQEDVDGYKQGAKAVISIVPISAPDQTVSVELSLKGFTAGFEAASEVQ